LGCLRGREGDIETSSERERERARARERESARAREAAREGEDQDDVPHLVRVGDIWSDPTRYGVRVAQMVRGEGARVWGLATDWCRVSGSGFRVSGFGFLV